MVKQRLSIPTDSPQVTTPAGLDREEETGDPAPREPLDSTATLPRLSLNYEPARHQRDDQHEPRRVGRRLEAATLSTDRTGEPGVPLSTEQALSSASSGGQSRLGEPVFGVVERRKTQAELVPDVAQPMTVDDSLTATADQRTSTHTLIRHRIVDGDTLERLAAKYLAGEDRWREIFQQNLGVLQTPDVLPIDAILVIAVPQSVSEPIRPAEGGVDGTAPE